MIGQAGRHWVALPATRQFDSDGKPKLDVNGKQQWAPTVEFVSREARDKYQTQVLSALRKAHPKLFSDEQ